MAQRRAAIDMDALMERPLGEISAADFLQVLTHASVRPSATLIADKKKYELWVEETVITKISLKEVLEKVRAEKKKVELEIPDWWRWRVNPPEVFQPDFGRLVEEVAAAVEQRIGRG